MPEQNPMTVDDLCRQLSAGITQLTQYLDDNDPSNAWNGGEEPVHCPELRQYLRQLEHMRDKLCPPGFAKGRGSDAAQPR